MTPLLEALTSITQQILGTPPSDTAALKQLLGIARLALRTFFSMNSPGLTPVRLTCLHSRPALCRVRI